MTRLRVVYVDVTTDLPDRSTVHSDERQLEIVVDDIQDGHIKGTTDDGLDVIVYRGGKREVRTRPAGADQAYRTMLGYRRRLEGVDARGTHRQEGSA